MAVSPLQQKDIINQQHVLVIRLWAARGNTAFNNVLPSGVHTCTCIIIHVHVYTVR